MEFKYKPAMEPISDEALVERTTKVRDFALAELMSHQKGIEREENGEVTSSPELRSQHLTSIELATQVLNMIESEGFVTHCKSISADKWRSDRRKNEGTFVKAPFVSQRELSEYDLHALRVVFEKVQDYLYEQYEPAVIQAESGEATVSLTSQERYALTTKTNFVGMALRITDGSDLVFNWRDNVIQALRDPDTEF